MTAESELKQLIRQEEERVLASFPLQRRAGLLELVRAMDAFFAHLHFSPGAQKRRGLSTTDGARREDELKELHNFGWSKALSLFMDESVHETAAPLFNSTRESQGWADSVLQHCGRVGICEMLMDMCRAGIAEITMSAPYNFQFRFTARRVGIESLEARDSFYVRNLLAKFDSPLLREAMSHRPEMMHKMSALVSPWREHYIQYETTPEIDGFYRQLGILWTRQRLQSDPFPPEAVLGGLPFAVYLAGVTTMAAWALKHLDFSQALLAKNSSLDFRNVTTIFQTTAILSDSLSRALDISPDAAAHVVDVLTLRTDTAPLLTSPKSSIAPFVAVAAGHVIISVAGSLTGGSGFLAAELRRRFRSDWDRSVDLRESAFRQDLYRLFLVSRYTKVDKTVKLKRAGKAWTDIDATIFDRRTGTIGLFQLKWQDPFGSSMKMLSSKRANLLEEGNRWVGLVSDWLQTNGLEGFANALGLGRVLIIDVTAVRLFVIGRNFSRFSGEDRADERAAWGQWPQLLRLINEEYDAGDPLTWLFNALRRDSPYLKLMDGVVGYDFQLGRYRVSLLPPSPTQLGRYG